MGKDASDSEHRVLSGPCLMRWVKVLTAFEILNLQLEAYNETARESGCPEHSFDAAARLWRAAHVDR
jgi:hypothetical protein